MLAHYLATPIGERNLQNTPSQCSEVFEAAPEIVPQRATRIAGSYSHGKDFFERKS